MLRPPVAQDALELTGDGKVLLRLRRPWRDGTRAICSEPVEFLEKLSALVPRPRTNLLIYHGVFAPRGRGPGELGSETEEATTLSESGNHPGGGDFSVQVPAAEERSGGQPRGRQRVALPALLAPWLQGLARSRGGRDSLEHRKWV